MTDDDAQACRSNCVRTHINGECRTRCMAHHRYWNAGEGLRQTAATNEAAAAERRAAAQAPFTAYSQAQRHR
jgi:hypothetical protein